MKQSGTSSWLLDTDRVRRAALLLCSVALHAGIMMAWPNESKKPDAVSMGVFSAPVNLSFVSVAKPPPPKEPEPAPKPKVVKAEVKPKPKIVKKAPLKVAKQVKPRPVPKPTVKPKPPVRPKPKPKKLAEQKPKPRPPVAQAVASSIAKASKQQGIGEIPVVTNPMFRRPPKPADYPRQAQRRNQQGTVLVEALVDEKGDVVSIKIVRSSGFPLLDRSATKAVRKWAFQPRMVGSRATKSKVQVPVLFELRG